MLLILLFGVDLGMFFLIYNIIGWYVKMVIVSNVMFICNYEKEFYNKYCLFVYWFIWFIWFFWIYNIDDKFLFKLFLKF